MDFSHVNIPGKGELRATFETSMGDIVVRFFERECPKTVKNFVGLATGQITWTDPRTNEKSNDPLYDGTIFHRVIPRFMIQGGDPLGEGIGGPGYEFADEFNRRLRHDKPGILSMANSGPGTNGSQFFLTEVPTPHLDGRHSIFGEVLEGMDVVREITGVSRNHMDRPNTDVVLRHVHIYRA